MERWNRSIGVYVAAAVLTGVLLASQALVNVEAPDRDTSAGSRFAFMGGLRIFAANVLWNRIEPQFHEYYSGISLTDQTYMMPTLRAVTYLNPQFPQAYYVATWIAYKNVGMRDALEIARAGVENNPSSGTMHANLVQMLFIQDAEKNSAEMIEHVRLILSGTLTWTDDDNYYEGLAVTVEPLKNAGEADVAEVVLDELERMRVQGVGAGDHDHDGDGAQDH